MAFAYETGPSFVAGNKDKYAAGVQGEVVATYNSSSGYEIHAIVILEDDQLSKLGW